MLSTRTGRWKENQKAEQVWRITWDRPTPVLALASTGAGGTHRALDSGPSALRCRSCPRTSQPGFLGGRDAMGLWGSIST